MRKPGEDMEMREESLVVPTVLGFTPFNQLRSSSAQEESIRPQASIKSNPKATEESLPGREKKRKAPSTPTPLNQTRKLRTFGRSRGSDISKKFRSRKPNAAGQRSKVLTDSAFLVGSSVDSKPPARPEDLFKKGSEADFHGQRPGSAEEYEARFDARFPATSDLFSSSQSFQVSSDTGFESSSEFVGGDLGCKNNVSVQRVTNDMHEHSIASQIFGRKRPSLCDFEPPPSAQLPRTTFEEPLAAPVLPDHHIVEQNFPRDNAFYDAFFRDADSSEGGEQGREPTSHGEPISPDETIQDKDLEDHPGYSPDDVSMTDAFTIYDDGTQRETGGKPAAGHWDSMPILRQVSSNVIRPIPTQFPSSQDLENEFCGCNKSKFEPSQGKLISRRNPQEPSTQWTSPHLSSSPKLQWLPPKTFTPIKPQSIVPVLQNDVSNLVPINATGKHLPFARPLFPRPVLDRSPILGLSNKTVLRTCFRIGEALNAAAQGSRSNSDAIIELFARVASSFRQPDGGFKQYFQFADLFTDKPPYLSGTSTIWKGVGLWDQDSKVFLGGAGRGKMCRAVGRIKRREASVGGGCEMTVLSVWEVDWEDVDVAKGVVCS